MCDAIDFVILSGLFEFFFCFFEYFEIDAVFSLIFGGGEKCFWFCGRAILFELMFLFVFDVFFLFLYFFVVDSVDFV